MNGFPKGWYYTVSLGIQVAIPLIFISQNVVAESVPGFSPEKAGFSVKFKDEVSPYRIIGVFVLPKEILTLEVPGSDKKDRYVLKAPAGKMTQIKTNKWYWQAPPKAGLYPVKIARSPSLDSITLNIFVMISYNQLKEQYLNGYRIGTYPLIPLKGLPIYEPPRGFIEVTKENQETLVAPHFKLKQFLCKQEEDYPKYVVLQERLLLKLELILEEINEKGYRAETLYVMSGYRTPFYNKSIGNVNYSRHIYGDAADIFIDENPRDGMMDDLNRDDKIDSRDSALLYSIIDDMHEKPWYKSFTGGLGNYKKTSSHGPFVHVDVRGFPTKWGDLIKIAKSKRH